MLGSTEVSHKSWALENTSSASLVPSTLWSRFVLLATLQDTVFVDYAKLFQLCR